MLLVVLIQRVVTLLLHQAYRGSHVFTPLILTNIRHKIVDEVWIR